MTILPKKKPSKDKNTDSDSTEHKSHGHHQNQNEVRQTHNRNRNSPQWMPSTSRDGDVIPPHDPGGTTSHDMKNPAHNKRRHRTSPHRTVRKHRTCGSSIQSVGAAPVSPSDSVSGYNSGDEHEMPNINSATDMAELERWFERTLHEKKGLVIKKMGEDGACLFRAVADQIYGDQEMHAVVRKQCLDYMAKNADYFKHYITEDFNTYLNRKRMEHCHGNNVEMQAIGEMYNRGVEVYQYSMEPINTFHGAYKTDNAPIRVSYHNGVHYNSVVDPYGATIGVGLGLPGLQPGMADKNLVKDAMRQSEDFHIEQAMMEDKLRETDWEVTQEAMQEQVARESYLQWIRDQEKHAHPSRKSASASCSSSCDPEAAMVPPQTRSPMPRPCSGQSSPHQAGEASAPSPPRTLDCLLVSASSNARSSGHTSPTMTSPHVGGVNFSETASLMDFDPALYGLDQWDEDDIMARVMAESHREYFENLKKKSTMPHTAIGYPITLRCEVPPDDCPASGAGTATSQMDPLVFRGSRNVGDSVVFRCDDENPSNFAERSDVCGGATKSDLNVASEKSSTTPAAPSAAECVSMTTRGAASYKIGSLPNGHSDQSFPDCETRAHNCMNSTSNRSVDLEQPLAAASPSADS